MRKSAAPKPPKTSKPVKQKSYYAIARGRGKGK